MDGLSDVFIFLDEHLEHRDLDPEACFTVRMAVEEIFTNMVKYNAESSADISIDLTITGEAVSVSLVDQDSRPFDLTARDDVDTTAELSERTPGGLGIHLVKKLMDEISYDYRDGVTRIRLVKYLNH